MTFSLIIPTASCVEQLKELLDSLRSATTQPDRLELIVVVDADDAATRSLSCEGQIMKQITGLRPLIESWPQNV